MQRPTQDTAPRMAHVDSPQNVPTVAGSLIINSNHTFLMSQSQKYTDELIHFINASPTAYHVVSSIRKRLLTGGFYELDEKKKWDLERGRNYFVTRDGGGLIAFTLGKNETVADGFRMMGCHTDSPSLHVKPQPNHSEKGRSSIGVEVYGGPLLTTWFDRDLSLAGRVCITAEDGTLRTVLIDFARPLLTIPSLAIHLDREANTNKSIDKQKDITPFLSVGVDGNAVDLNALVKEQLHKEYPELHMSSIVSFDLFCYDHQKPTLSGARQEILCASRLDNQLSCHAGMRAMLDSDKSKNSMFLCYNHEENGSTSTSGAQGSFVDAVLDRISPTREEKFISLANSFLISMDNAHATHPNFPEKTEPQHQIYLNHGPVIKTNANNRYATNAVSCAIYKAIATEAGVQTQDFVMRNDMACGSTIGPTSAARLGVATVDVGAPTLAMHSIRELTGVLDPYYIYKVSLTYLQSNIHRMHG